LATYYLIRHGVTDWLEEGIIQGISDRPLSPFGLDQAQLTGRAFKDIKASRLFVSPMKRAIQTAQPISIATGLAMETLDGLREKDQGWMEGKRDIWQYLEGKKILSELFTPIFLLSILLSGETQSAFKGHVLDAWRTIRSQEEEWPVIVVAHSGVFQKILMHEFGGGMGNFKKFYTHTCSITEIAIDAEGHARLVNMNDTGHLDGKTWG
jgi:broad specificity phosphatase PhoE